MWEHRFADRREGGRALAAKLAPQYARRDDVVVLGLPRGGLPVAAEVARALAAPLDVLIVRKLGAPGHEELAMGALACGDVVVRNEDVLDFMHHPEQALADALERERRELRRREREYLGGRSPQELTNKTVIVVDDGMATGATMRAAVAALRRRGVTRIVVAVPHAAHDSCMELRRLADECVCCQTPSPYVAVGAWYHDFPQTSDAEVKEILQSAAEASASHKTAASTAKVSRGA
jgi:predicted phosphoribosyltransferase